MNEIFGVDFGINLLLIAPDPCKMFRRFVDNRLIRFFCICLLSLCICLVCIDFLALAVRDLIKKLNCFWKKKMFINDE